MLTDGQWSPNICLGSASVHRGVPGESDTALSAQHGTSYQSIHGKGATLQHLRTIDSRAFVQIETHIKKLEERSLEGRICGYS